MKKRENELSRRKYRESYIYSENDKLNESSSNPIKLKAENWMEYQQEPVNKYLYFNNNIDKKDEQNSPLSASKNLVVDKESLDRSQNYNISPLSKDMKPIMDKFDRQISKLQFNNDIDLSSSNETEQTIKSLTEKSTDQVDFANSFKSSNQINTNPFLDSSNFKQLNYQPKEIDNFDEFVIEHKNDDSNNYNHLNNSNLSMLTVQPSQQLIKVNDLEINEIVNRPLQNQNNLIVKLNKEFIDNKPNNNQTFSLESLTCSGLSEPSSSSGISGNYKMLFKLF